MKDIDRRIATEVMGWTPPTHWPDTVITYLIPPYSSCVKTAFIVVEKLRLTHRLWLHAEDPLGYTADFVPYDADIGAKVYGESPAEAICLAALALKEGLADFKNR